jgi:monoterpene epsilon-lactone hydrolase
MEIGPQVPPLPDGASGELREALEDVGTGLADSPVGAGAIPQSEAEWLELIAALDAPHVAQVRAMAEELPVSLERDEIGGVPVYWVTPDEIAPEHDEQLFVHIHGGAYILRGGEACAVEAIAIAVGTRMPALSIDYRMAPRHPFPAAVDDVVAVWQSLLDGRRGRSMAMGGSSAGGGLTLNAVQRLIRENISVPGALFVGTPGSDLSGTGDTFHTNRGVDRNTPVFEGLLDAMVRLHADGRDMTDPLISAIYGDFDDFPPTLLATGTRDLFLSNTVRTHIKLRQAGSVADILVYEGVSHGDYLHELATPESEHFIDELDRFLVTHLARTRRRPSPQLTRIDTANELGRAIGPI